MSGRKGELLQHVRGVIDAVLAQTLRGQQYSEEKVASWNAQIAKVTIERLKEVSNDEFKFCVSSVIIRQAADDAAQGLALKSHTSALGDPDTDGHVSTTFETETLLCICMCHVVAGKTNNTEGGFWTYLKPSTYLEPLVTPIVGPPPPAPPADATASGDDISNGMMGSLKIPFLSPSPSEAESPSERSSEETKSPPSTTSSLKQRGAKYPKTAERNAGCLNCFPSTESRDDPASEIPEDPTVVHTRRPQQQSQSQQQKMYIPVPESPLFDRPSNSPQGPGALARSAVAGMPNGGGAAGVPAAGQWPTPPPVSQPPVPRSPTPSIGSALDLKERSPGTVDVARVENVKAVNEVLRSLAEDSSLQMDLRRPWVKEAMKIWGGEDTAHLSERDMEDIQDDEGVERVYPRMKELQVLCDKSKIKLPIDHVKSKKSKLSGDIIASSYGQEFLSNHKFLLQ